VSGLAVEGRANAAPSLASAGNLVAIAWGATGASGAADVFAALSTDGGRSFGSAVRVNDVVGTARISGEMAPRVTVLAREGRSAVMHVLWTAKGSPTSIRLAMSGDGGRTFAPSRALQAEGAEGDRGWAALAAGPDGRPRAVWLDHRGMADGASEEAGHHHGHDSAAAGSQPGDGAEMAQRSAIYVSDGGVERAVASGVCYCCKTALVTRPDGRLFAAWRHVYPGNIRDIAFASAGSDGLEFTPPVRVSQDEWQIDGCPDDGPAMAAGADGTLHLVWPTVVSQPAPHKAMFYASSRDGRTFTSRVRVTPVGRSIAHPQIAAAADGQIAVAWDEIVEGGRRVFLSQLANGTFTPEASVNEDGSASYPVVVFSDDNLVVAWTDGSPESSRIAIRALPLRR
jgi:hypothetical protein